MRIDEGRISDNHAGWEVQVLTADGWKGYGRIKETKEESISQLLEYKKMFPYFEWRVYESLKEKE